LNTLIVANDEPFGLTNNAHPHSGWFIASGTSALGGAYTP